jgi:hypothetical protein
MNDLVRIANGICSICLWEYKEKKTTLRRMKMTLDEAIVHAKELSESQSVCEDCREEHKQLAEWLEELNEYKNIFEEEHPFNDNSFNFLNFKIYSNSTLKRFTKDELIDYINILYFNWKNTDNTCERVSRLAKQLYEKAKEYKKANEKLEHDN